MEKSWPGCKGDPTIGKARPSEASLPYKYDLGYTIRVDNEPSCWLSLAETDKRGEEGKSIRRARKGRPYTPENKLGNQVEEIQKWSSVPGKTQRYVSRFY